MTCAELIELMLDFLGGELIAEMRARAEVHLAGCPNCTFYLESYTHTVKVARALPRCVLPAAFEARLRQALGGHFGTG